MGKWVYRWKRCARHRWRGVNRKRGSGGSLFVDDPEAWVSLAAVQAAAGEQRSAQGAEVPPNPVPKTPSSI